MAVKPFTIDGISVATAFHQADSNLGATPLLVALHGGTYTSAYFAVAGGEQGSFLDVATRNGFDVLTVDRPGYGQSDPLPESENTFVRQAELLDGAISQALGDATDRAVVLVGHSIGGMIALEIAARTPAWLVGVTATGMGARIPSGGAAEQLGGLPLSGIVDLPVPDRDAVMFGPAGTFSEKARDEAHGSYAPTPFVELVSAPKWAASRLRTVAPKVSVPVHNALAELDALWDSSQEAIAEFAGLFCPPASAERVLGVGHSIDHHLLGAALHLRQLAFAYSCGVLAAAAASAGERAGVAAS